MCLLRAQKYFLISLEIPHSLNPFCLTKKCILVFKYDYCHKWHYIKALPQSKNKH